MILDIWHDLSQSIMLLTAPVSNILWQISEEVRLTATGKS